MEGDHSVYFAGRPCGKVQVLRQGLYYRFFCRCKLSGDILCRLRLCCGDTTEDLGILVPVEDGFGLERSVPVKRIGEGVPKFRLVTDRETEEGRFVPIRPEEPFAYLSRLKTSYLVRRDGDVGILV